MARNQPFDFSDEDDLSLTRNTDFDDAEFTESGLASPYGTSGHAGDGMTHHQTGAASQASRAQTTTPTRESAESWEANTSMSKKRGNQPR